MRRLNSAITSLEAVNVNLQAALTYIDKALRDANEIKATDLVTRLEAIKTTVQALDPCKNPIELLRELAAEYTGTLEEIERKERATQIVNSLSLKAEDKQAAIVNVSRVLENLDTKTEVVRED